MIVSAAAVAAAADTPVVLSRKAGDGAVCRGDGVDTVDLCKKEQRGPCININTP